MFDAASMARKRRGVRNRMAYYLRVLHALLGLESRQIDEPSEFRLVNPLAGPRARAGSLHHQARGEPRRGPCPHVSRRDLYSRRFIDPR